MIFWPVVKDVLLLLLLLIPDDGRGAVREPQAQDAKIRLVGALGPARFRVEKLTTLTDKWGPFCYLY